MIPRSVHRSPILVSGCPMAQQAEPESRMNAPARREPDLPGHESLPGQLVHRADLLVRGVWNIVPVCPFKIDSRNPMHDSSRHPCAGQLSSSDNYHISNRPCLPGSVMHCGQARRNGCSGIQGRQPDTTTRGHTPYYRVSKPFTRVQLLCQCFSYLVLVLMCIRSP